MITGFNDDLEYNGIIYHIQTEDRGTNSPFVETRVYRGGANIYLQKTPYTKVRKHAKVEDIIKEIMTIQHLQIKEDVLAGKFDDHKLDTLVDDLRNDVNTDKIIVTFLSKD